MAQIKGYEGLYEIFPNGTIINSQTGWELKGNINSYGYRVVSLTKDGVRKDHKVHRLLAKAFIPNPNNYRCINHIDGNKLNNSLSNLEWCTHGQNTAHARATLNIDFSRKPIVQTTVDGKLIAVWNSANVAAHFLKGSATMISACCKGRLLYASLSPRVDADSCPLMMPSNYLILCHPFLLLPSVFPSIKVFSNELALCIRWTKY